MTNRTFDALWADYSPARVRGLKTEREVIRTYEVYVRPSLGKRLVGKTDFKTLVAFHAAMKESPYQANRVLSLLRTMFEYAGPNGLKWVDGNPAKGVKMFTEKKRRRHMTPAEAPIIARIMAKHEEQSPFAVLFLWMVIFTGARSGEIKSACWKHLKGNKLVLSEHKSDHKGTDRVISLPPAAMRKIKLYKPQHPDAKIIPLSRPEYVWELIRREAGCPDLRIHDLRHTFGTYALEQGYNLDQIGEALEHSNPATTKIYAEMRMKTRDKMALDVSDLILQDMEVRDVEVDPLS